ncbi:MAG: nuclear transport factor 2 family protein [Mycobacteriaceae bacterium]
MSTTNNQHPARSAATKSMSAVKNKQKEQWLSLFADTAVVEDPVGPSGFDPEGKGHHGLGGIAAFWDMSVALTKNINFTITDSFACGNEVANIGTISTTISGQIINADGVFIYRVNDEGKIVSLRAFWELDRALATARPAP